MAGSRSHYNQEVDRLLKRINLNPTDGNCFMDLLICLCQEPSSEGYFYLKDSEEKAGNEFRPQEKNEEGLTPLEYALKVFCDKTITIPESFLEVVQIILEKLKEKELTITATERETQRKRKINDAIARGREDKRIKEQNSRPVFYGVGEEDVDEEKQGSECLEALINAIKKGDKEEFDNCLMGYLDKGNDLNVRISDEGDKAINLFQLTMKYKRDGMAASIAGYAPHLMDDTSETKPERPLTESRSVGVTMGLEPVTSISSTPGVLFATTGPSTLSSTRPSTTTTPANSSGIRPGSPGSPV